MPNETTTCDVGGTASGETQSARTASADAKARPAQDRVLVAELQSALAELQ
ncbi:hypothetical protein PV367_01690 [Streptomyces europaeiscabiei]|uniref:Uncharacterized protein n=2 Tax=Streptomyces TaxID=1883 RepID=A0AAJ2PJP7_9ACTN|nr:hypothetical protein [Streptomyces europaeiscabiei]MDX3128542.1 hypothetical protein [Streptomyces europaeiscabiei]